MNNLKIIICTAVALILLCSCNAGSGTAAFSGGDTVRLKYAELLTIVRHDSFTVVTISDPWNKGKTLHTYVLVDEKRFTDGMAAHIPATVTVVRTPLRRAVVTTSVHCGLMVELEKGEAIKGVCDLRYINQPWIKRQFVNGKIADCGNSTAPTLEKIIEINADAVLISPFQNSGGYGRLDEWGSPIIEMADYMETSALGRAEWMKFYGMLFGAERQADSMFEAVEKNYNRLKETAKKSHTRKSVILDKVEGSVWYVPGGHSTIGGIIADANAGYAFSSDKSSGSLQLTFETVLAKAGCSDVWMYRYDGIQPATYASLLAENKGYSEFKAFKEKAVYGCNTTSTTFYEDTPFRPDLLLRDFIIITHPDITSLGRPKYFEPLK